MVVFLLIRLREQLLRTMRTLLLLALFSSLLLAVYGVVRTEKTAAQKEIRQHGTFRSQGLAATANGENNWFEKLIIRLKEYYYGEQ